MDITDLLKKFEALPLQQQEEVVDFVDFLASRYSAQPRQRQSAMGKYAGMGTSSDEYARRKDEEIERVDRKR